MGTNNRDLAKWYIRIDGWHPTKLNQMLNARHWSIAHRAKKHDANVIALAVLGAGVEKAKRQRRVSLEIVLAPRQRGGDCDAYWKSLLDGLVKCGALKDDNRQWCELGELTFSRGPRKATVICLEDLYEPKPVISAAVERDSKRSNRTLGLRLVAI